LLVRVEDFLHAKPAVCPVSALEASVQAAVPNAVAEAVAGQLANDIGDFGRQLIGANLIGILEGITSQLVLGENGQCVAGLKWSIAVSRHAVTLGHANHGEQCDQQEERRFLHEGKTLAMHCIGERAMPHKGRNKQLSCLAWCQRIARLAIRRQVAGSP